MSAETAEWLNTMCLIGFTDKRGEAWHYKAELQGDEPNHYPGAIPAEDITRRLFNFTVEEQPIFLSGMREIPGRKAMVTSDTKEVLGIFKGGYQGHGYEEWLINVVSGILDHSVSDIEIAGAGLLRNRAQAYVQFELPETLTVAGFGFRPFLQSRTSYDGSLATGYGTGATAIVCDNTLAMATSSEATTFKIRHSRYSGMRLADAREALGLLVAVADDFSAEVERLTAWKVEDSTFGKLLDVLIPVPNDEGRGQTVANKKRDSILSLYRNDERVAPWNGTALGVLQAFNTWNHHEAGVRKGVHRAVRNAENAVMGKFAQADALVLKTLAGVS